MSDDPLMAQAASIIADLMGLVRATLDLDKCAEGSAEHKALGNRLADNDGALNKAVCSIYAVLQMAAAKQVSPVDAVKAAELDNLRATAESNRAAAEWFRSMAGEAQK